jgi:hypothetical protein
VSYAVGRESSTQYNESLNGYRSANQGHEFSVAVDPFARTSKNSTVDTVRAHTNTSSTADTVVPGEAGGMKMDREAPRELLQMVERFDPSESTPGQADKKVQSYNFRLCVTQNTSNQVKFVKPAGYDASYWELARRYGARCFAHGISLKV